MFLTQNNWRDILFTAGFEIKINTVYLLKKLYTNESRGYICDKKCSTVYSKAGSTHPNLCRSFENFHVLAGNEPAGEDKPTPVEDNLAADTNGINATNGH